MVSNDDEFCNIFDRYITSLKKSIEDYKKWGNKHVKQTHILEWDYHTNILDTTMTEYIELYNQKYASRRYNQNLTINRFDAIIDFLYFIETMDNYACGDNWRNKSQFNYRLLQSALLNELKFEDVAKYAGKEFKKLIESYDLIEGKKENMLPNFDPDDENNAINKKYKEFNSNLDDAKSQLHNMIVNSREHPEEYTSLRFVEFVSTQCRVFNEFLDEAMKGPLVCTVPSFFLLANQNQKTYSDSLVGMTVNKNNILLNFDLSGSSDGKFMKEYVKIVSKLHLKLVNSIIKTGGTEGTDNIQNLTARNSAVNFLTSTSNLQAGVAAGNIHYPLDRFELSEMLLDFIKEIDGTLHSKKWRTDFNYDGIFYSLRQLIGIRSIGKIAHITVKNMIKAFNEQCENKGIESIQGLDEFKNSTINSTLNSLKSCDESVDNNHYFGTIDRYVTIIKEFELKIISFCNNNNIKSPNVIPAILLRLMEGLGVSDSDDDNSEDENDEDMKMTDGNK